MMEYTEFFSLLDDSPLQSSVNELQTLTRQRLDPGYHGDTPRWRTALDALPKILPSHIDLDLDCPQIGAAEDLTLEQNEQLLQALRALHPWRKGPFQLFGVHVDTEWRSDWKWQRLAPHISSLHNRRILDVGCGNGYYLLRMLAAKPAWALGIDPTLLFIHQFLALKSFLPSIPAAVLPMGMEEFPARSAAFDTVFSMGVLYHRRSPLDHLYELRDALRPGGELVLETLVIDGEAGQILLPADRYARMRNVWFIPSALELQAWLQRCGFTQVRVVDVSCTTIREQRSTAWMQFESLEQCLDPKDPNKTIEGYPAPRRALMIAERPA